MTSNIQGDYEASASSEPIISSVQKFAWKLFDNLRTGTPNAYTDNWNSDLTYDSSNSFLANTSGAFVQLSSNTVYGEWAKIKLRDKRKLSAYKLSRQDHTNYDAAPRKFRLYGSNDNSTWVEIVGSAVTRGATDPINSYSSTPNSDSTTGSRFNLSTVSPAYQYIALVIEQTHNAGRVALQEFELICVPAEIENFKLYGSIDDAAWTEIHDQSTSANITSSGTDFTITNSGSYQHYGIVITKTNSHNNVSIGEMTLGVDSPIPQCLAKGTWIKPIDNANNGLVPGVLSSSFNVSTISQITTANSISRYGVNHRFFSFQVTFTNALSNANYQVNITEVNQIKTILNYYGCILNHSVMNKQTTGFDIYMLVDPLSFTATFPSFGIDFIVF